MSRQATVPGDIGARWRPVLQVVGALPRGPVAIGPSGCAGSGLLWLRVPALFLLDRMVAHGAARSSSPMKCWMECR